MHSSPTFLTVSEVAERLRVDPATIRRWISDGTLPATRLGKNFRIDASDVDALIERSRVAPGVISA